MSLDGRASFRELRERTGGHEISRSSEDRWLMDFLRAHHNAQLMGANTLREEPGRDAPSWDFGIDDKELRSYRRETLKLRQQTVIIPRRGVLTFLCEFISPEDKSKAIGFNS